MINNYSKNHVGHLPIRVLQFNLLRQFEITTPKFSELKKTVIEECGLNEHINYVYNTDSFIGNKVEGPCVIDSRKEIKIDESFLAFLWCMSYSLFILTEHLLQEKDDITLEKAKNLIKYARSLLCEYSDWDKEKLINPEVYLEADRTDIEKANEIYIYGINFIICHEFQHVKLRHIDKKNSRTLTNQEKLENEIEADKEAIELIISGRNELNKNGINIGIATALCALLFTSGSVAKKVHPYTDTRIITALDQLGVEENHLVWLIACSSLNIWFNEFNISKHWNDEIKTYREQFEYLSRQLE